MGHFPQLWKSNGGMEGYGWLLFNQNQLQMVAESGNLGHTNVFLNGYT